MKNERRVIVEYGNGPELALFFYDGEKPMHRRLLSVSHSIGFAVTQWVKDGLIVNETGTSTSKP